MKETLESIIWEREEILADKRFSDEFVGTLCRGKLLRSLKYALKNSKGPKFFDWKEIEPEDLVIEKKLELLPMMVNQTMTYNTDKGIESSEFSNPSLFNIMENIEKIASYINSH